MTDDFADVITGANAFGDNSTDLPSSFPDYLRPQKNKKSKAKRVVKYRTYNVGANGNPELEEIMTSCLNGERVLFWEKVFTTKEGIVKVAIRYLEDLAEPTIEKEKDVDNDIKGSRRQRKASKDSQSD